MGARKLLYHVPLMWDYKEIAPKKMALISKGNTGNFSERDYISIRYGSGYDGDWKASKDGGDGYLLVTVDGIPYWADAIGQIPFAIDTYREAINEGKTPEQAIQYVIDKGIEHGDGGIIFPKKDNTSGYDNFMIARATVYVKYAYRDAYEQYKNLPHLIKEFYKFGTGIELGDADKLGEEVTKDLLNKYLSELEKQKDFNLESFLLKKNLNIKEVKKAMKELYKKNKNNQKKANKKKRNQGSPRF